MSRIAPDYTSNVSSFHKKVGEILQNCKPWKGHKIFQEYPVKDINSTFKSGREKFDWYLPDLRLVIEVMGQQHDKPVQFGGKSEVQAKFDLIKRRSVDQSKMQAAIDVGCFYIAVWYDEDITAELLWKRYLEASGGESD